MREGCKELQEAARDGCKIQLSSPLMQALWGPLGPFGDFFARFVPSRRLTYMHAMSGKTGGRLPLFASKQGSNPLAPVSSASLRFLIWGR